MALGEETAILEVEIEDGDAFEELNEKAEVSGRQIMQAAKKGMAFWKDFFEFLKSGSAETAARIGKIEAAVGSMKRSLADATAQSGPVNALLSTMEEVLRVSQQLPGSFNALGTAIGALVTGPLGSMLMLAREIRNVAQGGIAGGDQISAEIIRRTNAQVAAGNARAIGGAALANASTFAVGMGQAQAAVRANAALAGTARRGGGGGGGRQEEVMAFSEAEAEAAVRAFENSQRLMTDIQKDALRERDALNAAHYERERGYLEAQTAMRLEGEQSIIDAKRRETDEFEAMEAAKTNAIQATTQAMIQSTIATIAQGVAQGASAKQIAKRIAIASGWHALEEAAAGVGALAVTWGVPNPASTGHFISAAMYGGLAAAAGGVSAALPGGRGGGGGGAAGAGAPSDFAAPRGSAAGGGGTTINATIVLNAAGELVDDSTLRRMGRAIEEIERRGYAGGRR